MELNRFNVLDPKTDVKKNFFLQASAGTGKTFAIEHLVVRFLLEEKLLNIEQILVVTFTRAAVRDLKNRVRKNLEKVIGYLRTNDSNLLAVDELPYLAPYLKEEIRATSLRKLEINLALFDQAQIFTIHGFCQRMLGEFSFAAMQPIDMSTDVQSKVFSENVTMDFLRYHLSKEQFHPYQIASLMRKARKTSLFLEKLSFQAQTPDQREGENESVYFYLDLFNKALAKVPSLSKALFDNDFEQVISHFKVTNFDLKNIRAQAVFIGNLLEEKTCSKELFEKFLAYDFSVFSFIAQKNRKKKFPAGFERIHAFLEQINRYLFPVIEKITDKTQVLQSLSSALGKKMEEKREEEDLLSHDSILKKMDESIQKYPAFKEAVQKKFQVAIIDEFQDTDPIQWNIFEALFLKRNTSLLSFYLVGDPKQSIYSFRNADLYSYLNAEEMMGEEAQAHLDTNYRSSPQLIASLNFLFSEKVAKEWLRLPKLEKSLKYLPVRAGLKDNGPFDKSKAALHFLLVESKGSSKGWPTKSMEKELFFPKIIQEIVRLKEESNGDLEFSDFAILVSSRFQAQSLKNAFDKHQMPYVMRTSESLLETKAAKAMRDFLLAIENPYDLSALKGALAGNIIQMRADQLLSEELMVLAQAKLIHLQSLLKDYGFAKFFSSFWDVDWHQEGRTLMERLVSGPSLSFYSHLVSVMDLMRDYLDSKSLFLVEEFEKLAELDPETEKRLNATLFFDDKGIQILTTHSSKGLEFEVVFALGIAFRPPAPDEDVNEVELDAEKSRQLYVALTRAKKRVYVPIAFDENSKPIAKGRASPLELFFSYVLDQKLEKGSLLPFVEEMKKNGLASYEWLSSQSVKPEVNHAPILDVNIPDVPFASYRFLERKLLSFTSLTSQDKTHKKSLVENENYVFSMKKLPPGPFSGVVIHKIFERIFREFSQYPGAEKILSLVVSETQMGPLKGYEEAITELVDRAFHASLFPGDSFALKDLSFVDAEVEMEFMYPEKLKGASDFLKGSIDLLFRYNGRYFLLDWKSNWLGDSIKSYDRSSLKVAMDDHQYNLQASIYKKAFCRFFQALHGQDIGSSFGGVVYLFLRGLPSVEEESQDSGVYYFNSSEEIEQGAE